MGAKNARHRSQVTLRKKRGDKLKQKQRGRGGDQRPPRLKVFLRFCFIAAPPRHQWERKREVGRSGNKSKCFKKWSVLSSDAFSDPSPLPSAVFSLKIRLSVAQVPGLSSKPISETESRWLGVPPGGSTPDPRNRPNSETQSRRQGADLTGRDGRTQPSRTLGTENGREKAITRRGNEPGNDADSSSEPDSGGELGKGRFSWGLAVGGGARAPAR